MEQGAWNVIEKFIAVTISALGATLMGFWMYVLFGFLEPYLLFSSRGYISELFFVLIRIYPILFIIGLVTASGVLLWRQNKYGWIGSVLTLLLLVIGLIVFWLFDLAGYRDPLTNDMMILCTVIAVILLLFLWSIGIRYKYDVSAVSWLIAAGGVTGLVANFMVIRILLQVIRDF